MINLEPLYKPAAVNSSELDARLIVVSNRVPLPSSSAEPAAGGLAVALRAALKPRGGLWFGWSGKTSEESGPTAQCRTVGSLTYAVCDLSRRDIEQYYCGFANRALWPICHYRLDLANLSESNAAAYFRVNEHFARQLHKLLRPDDIIWVHDYHLIPMARFLRQMGCANRIGFFLHIPWPGPDVASALPAYQRILRCFGAYDVVGFQTEADADNFRDCIINAHAGRTAGGDWCEIDGRRMQLSAFPIGIDSEAFAKDARAAEKNNTVKRMLASLNGRDLVIGVDRLDYSKGLKQRMEAFATFLERSPEAARARVTMLQITPKSRSEVPEYARMQRELEEEAGRRVRRGYLALASTTGHPISCRRSLTKLKRRDRQGAGRSLSSAGRRFGPAKRDRRRATSLDGSPLWSHDPWPGGGNARNAPNLRNAPSQ